MKIYFILASILFASIGHSYGQRSVSPGEFMINSTVKIEVIEKKYVNGVPKHYQSSGTGFFFELDVNGARIPLLVTNRHVVKDALLGVFHFKIADTGKLAMKRMDTIKMDKFSSRWIYHPDTAVDLAVIPIARYLNSYNNKREEIIYTPYREKDLPNDSILNTLTPIEEIIMIGYPFGLRDNINDLPIVRRGITATPPYLNYNSADEFLCDVPVYPGSSGSPIILFNPNSFTTRSGENYMRSRVILLGINYATFTRDFEGKVLPKSTLNIEDSIKVTTPIFYNIGIVIKSSKILDFKALFKPTK